jgi:hypothetical protein
MLRSLESRFRDTPWLAERSSAIESAIEEVLRAKGAVADGILAEAAAALDEGAFDRVGVLLASRSGWTDTQRTAANELIGAAEKKREADGEARLRKRAMHEFARAFVDAGAKGLAEAAAFLEEKRNAMTEQGRGKMLDRLSGYAGQGKSVESLAAVTYSNTRGVVRLQIGQERVSGRITSVEAGVMTVKPAVGTPVEVMLGALDPKDIIDASGLMDSGTEGRVRIAAYYVARGKVEEAWESVRELTDEKAKTLTEDIESMKEALVEAVPDDRIAQPAESKAARVPAKDVQVDVSLGMPGIWAELETLRSEGGIRSSPLASSSERRERCPPPGCMSATREASRARVPWTSTRPRMRRAGTKMRA